MSEMFMASNGLEVQSYHDGSVIFGTGGFLTPVSALALREFFLHEDGIWKDQETGAHVYRCTERDSVDGRSITIVYDGLSSYHWENNRVHDDRIQGVKDRYYAAHPAPKLWHDAKPKEAWLLTVDGVEGVYVTDIDNEFNGTSIDGHFMSYYRSYEGITAGERIWPEGDHGA